VVNAGDTAWVLASAALVMLMTPGLAFFYGGMVRSKSVLNMLMMNFVALGIVGVLWALYGFSLSFGNDIGGGLLGGGEFVGLANTVGHLAGFAGADNNPPWPGADAIPKVPCRRLHISKALRERPPQPSSPRPKPWGA